MPKVAMGTWSGSYKECAKSDYTCVQGLASDILVRSVPLPVYRCTIFVLVRGEASKESDKTYCQDVID